MFMENVGLWHLGPAAEAPNPTIYLAYLQRAIQNDCAKEYRDNEKRYGIHQVSPNCLR
uniref:Uncharacterized protein n=1 Tax=Candidatus Kentrum sp. TC TaxID=2126339 RepID=A0A450ZBZ2_9GAMM|nr:MAG: hypothetical protein BECKTC1821E_GA0114239_1001140 [Candidatus Kentron sp. TC]VFK51312.1 MAG: hypothetical protein BECKTC1821F_GA0114240_100141 [Candidatus Kentron sp. TC]